MALGGGVGEKRPRAVRGRAGEKPPRAGRRSAPGWPSRLVRRPKMRYSVGVVPGSADAAMWGGAAQLLGRHAECDVLDRFLGAVRAGESRALVVRGEPGAGKAALLKYLAGRASGCRVAAAAGVQSEMELAVARAVSAAPPRLHAPGASDLLLDGLAAHYNEGYTAAVPILRRALIAFGGMPADQELRWLSLAFTAAMHIWDDDRAEVLSKRYVERARKVGALIELPLALSRRVYVLLFAGELTAAAALVEEVQAATEATGTNFTPYAAMGLAALRGDEAEASALIEATVKDVPSRGEGLGITAAERANAVLNNGLGRYQKALAAAQRATTNDRELGFSNWALAELIEAATRSGMSETAAGAYRRLAEITGPSGTDWALGVQERSHALLSDGEEAEGLYRQAIARLGRTRARTDLARAHLLYGESLRRAPRPPHPR